MGVLFEKIQKLTELASAAAVVISLVFVGYQVRQNTAAVRSAAAQAVNESLAAWYTAVQSDRQLLGISMAGMKDYGALSSVDKAQFVALHMALLLDAQNAFYQWQEGWLSPELWQTRDFVFGIFLSTPGGRQFWEERSYMFGQDFQEHVEIVLQRDPHPKAKAWGNPDIYKPASE